MSAHATVLKGAINKSDPNVFDISLVTPTGEEKETFWLPEGTPEEAHEFVHSACIVPVDGSSKSIAPCSGRPHLVPCQTSSDSTKQASIRSFKQPWSTDLRRTLYN
jgi:hypothetical protein